MDTKYTHRTQEQIDNYKTWCADINNYIALSIHAFEKGEDGRAAAMLKQIICETIDRITVLSKAHGMAFQRLLSDEDLAEKVATSPNSNNEQSN